jgi:hypothetical protein
MTELNKIIEKVVPDIWSAYNDRNQIKSKHIDNIERLKLENEADVSFANYETHKLGDWALRKHEHTVSYIRSNGSPQGYSFKLNSQESVDKAIELSESVVRRIQLKNITSIIIWISLIVLIVGIFGYLL